MLTETRRKFKYLEQNSFNIKSHSRNESLYIKEWKSTKNSKIRHHFVILHDICDHHGRYEPLAESLWQKFNEEVNITFVDFKGHGLSSGTRSYIGNFDEYIDDLHLVLNEEETTGVKKVLIGQGLGALVALSYIEAHEQTAKNIISSVVLSNPLIFLHLELHKIRDKALRTFNKYAGKLRFPYHISGKELTSDRERYENYNSDPLINHYMSFSLVEEVLRKSRHLLDYSYFLDIPLLMLLSKNDFLVNWSKTSLYIKGMPKNLAHECIYSHCLHDLFNEKIREKVYSDIFNWLETKL